MSEILVSITTPAYNSEKTISRTIESVLNQTYQNIEYIIIDGKSSDNTLKIAKSYNSQFMKRKIKYKIISEKDDGMYDAINKGVILSSGEIIGNINSDDYYETNTVEVAMKTYLNDKYDMMYGDLRIIKKNGSFIKKAQLKKYIATRYWNHPSMFMNRKLLSTELYRVNNMYDDFELMCRIRSKKYKVVIVNQVLANFVLGGMSNVNTFRNYRIRLNSIFEIHRKYKRPLYYYIESFFIETSKVFIK